MHFLTSPVVIGTLPAAEVGRRHLYGHDQRRQHRADDLQPRHRERQQLLQSCSRNDSNLGGAADPTVTRVEQPPVVSNIAPSVNEDVILTFAAANFDAGFSDPNSDAPADTLQILRITSLPANGLLKITARPSPCRKIYLARQHWHPHLHAERKLQRSGQLRLERLRRHALRAERRDGQYHGQLPSMTCRASPRERIRPCWKMPARRP